MKNKTITVLHGTNYWSMGDLGLLEALLLSLNKEFKDARIYILSPFTKIERPLGQNFDLAKFGVSEIEGPTSFRTPHSSFLGKLAIMGSRALVLMASIVMKRKFNVSLPWILPKGMKEMLSIMCQSDLIISGPGGFLYDARDSRMPSAHHLFSIFLASLTGKPVVLYAQSIGPFDRMRFHWIVRFILNRTSLILVREEPSYEVCKSVLRLKGPEVRLTADEAFLLPDGDAKLGRSWLQEIGVPSGVNLVGLTILDWHFPNAPESLEAAGNYVNAMAELINHINDTYKAHVVIFPFCFAKGYSKNGDEAITAQLLKACGKHDMVHLFKGKDPMAIKSALRLMDVFVGSRMHSNIFALSCGVPVVAISYLPKTDGIMNMLGLSDFVLSIEGITPLDLKNRFDKMWAVRCELRESLPRKLKKIRDEAGKNIIYCRELLNRPLF
jgi:colanic acid/amylovoran biosynthesis protein